MRRAIVAVALAAATLGAFAQSAPPRQQPSIPESLTMRAAQRLQAGDMQGALADVGAAIMRDSRNSAAYALRGSIRMAMGDREGALLDLSRCIELTPDVKGVEVVFVNRANVHWLEGRRKEADADLASAYARNPNFALAYNLRGRIKAEDGDLDGARADLDRALALEPKMMPAYLARAGVNLQAGRLSESLSDYKTLMWSLPNDADVVASHGIVRGLMGETAAGVEDLLKARAMNSRSIGEADRSGRINSPVHRLDQFIEMNPAEGRAQLMRGVVSLLNDEGERAVRELGRAVQLDEKLRAEVERVRQRLSRQ